MLIFFFVCVLDMIGFFFLILYNKLNYKLIKFNIKYFYILLFRGKKEL